MHMCLLIDACVILFSISQCFDCSHCGTAEDTLLVSDSSMATNMGDSSNKSRSVQSNKTGDQEVAEPGSEPRRSGSESVPLASSLYE